MKHILLSGAASFMLIACQTQVPVIDETEFASAGQALKSQIENEAHPVTQSISLYEAMARARSVSIIATR